MVLFDQVYQWHPKLLIDNLVDDFFVVLDEENGKVFEFSQLNVVQEVLVKGNTLDELMSLYSLDVVLKVQSFLNSMLDFNYICRLDENSADFYSKNKYLWDAKDADIEKRSIVLSDIKGSSKLKLSMINHVRVTDLFYVFVDDFLDPRINRVHKILDEKNKSWLLIKVTGETCFVAGTFGAKNTRKGACWRCLYHHLLRNHPFRVRKTSKYLNGMSVQDSHVVPIPVKYDDDIIKKNLSYIDSVLGNIDFRGDMPAIYQMDSESDSLLLHPIIKRPQCSSCGDRDLFKKQSLKPIELKPTPKKFTKDGGVRTIDPEVTCQRLLKVVSPFSGLLTHCSSVSKEGEYVNQIYRSGFFQNPTLDSYIGAISNATFLYTTMGKGISKQQSMASALSEGIERLASQYQGDEYVFCAVPPLNTSDYILPQQLTPFTDRQYQTFDIGSNPEHQLYACEKYLSDRPIHWTQVWSLTHHKPKFVPLSYCYANTPFDDQKFSRFYHNGGAAGNTLEEAILQGFLEIIERDAIAIWWYNQTPRRMLNFEGVSDQLLKQLAHTLEEEWDFWTIDITTDFNVPVIAAISRNKATGQFCFGFGCHMDVHIACQRALTELCQITEIRDRNTAPFDFDAIIDGSYLFPDSQTPCQLKDFKTERNLDIKDDINYCLERARLLNLEVLVLNYSRPDMVLKTAKVIVPGTCHIFPYFAVDRLYQVPVTLGLLDEQKNEDNLNQQALLI